jgi:hypothetical protein
MLLALSALLIHSNLVPDILIAKADALLLGVLAVGLTLADLPRKAKETRPETLWGWEVMVEERKVAKLHSRPYDGTEELVIVPNGAEEAEEQVPVPDGAEELVVPIHARTNGNYLAGHSHS